MQLALVSAKSLITEEVQTPLVHEFLNGDRKHCVDLKTAN
jgi:hypothetical protein